MSPRAVSLAIGAAVTLAGGALVVSMVLLRAPDPPVPGNLDDADRAFATVAQASIDAVRDQPRDHQRWLTLGMMYEANQFMALAEECYATSAELGGGARAMYHLAVLRSRVGDVPGAIDAMQQTIAEDPSHGPAHWRLGFWLLDEHKLDEAEHAFREAMSHRSGPFDLAGEIGLARVYMMRGELDRAEAILQPTSQRPSPYAVYASHLLGTTLSRKGRMEEAKAALARGRAAEPVFPDPLHEQINAYRTDAEWLVMQAKGLVARGTFDQAIAMLEQAAHDRPNDSFVLNNLAIAYVGARRFDDANRVLESMLADSPGSYQGHFNLALAAHARASLAKDVQAAALRDEAIAHLDESLRLNPTFGGALGMKADLMAQSGHAEEALALYYQGLATEPTSGLWWRGAALSAAACGRFDEAMNCAAQLEALQPGDPHVAQLREQVQTMRDQSTRDLSEQMPGRTQSGNR